MIEQFEVKPSLLVAIYIAVFHVFTFIGVLYFDASVLIRAVVLLALLASLARALKQWACQQQFFIKYESVYQCWSVSNDAQQWQLYESLSVAYLNDTLVWITRSSPGGENRAVIIGVDSMANERFLQLRRCIFCPDMFDQRA